MSESKEVRHLRLIQSPQFIFNNEVACFRYFLQSEISMIAFDEETRRQAQGFLERVLDKSKAENANLPRCTKKLKDERTRLTRIRNQTIEFNKKFSEYLQKVDTSILREVGGLCLFLAAAFAAVMTMPISMTISGACMGLSLFGLYHFIGGYFDRVTQSEFRRANFAI